MCRCDWGSLVVTSTEAGSRGALRSAKAPAAASLAHMLLGGQHQCSMHVQVVDLAPSFNEINSQLLFTYVGASRLARRPRC